jgi:hypothetical protein
MFNWNEMKNKIILADNKDVMKDIPDKFFELAIVLMLDFQLYIYTMSL